MQFFVDSVPGPISPREELQIECAKIAKLMRHNRQSAIAMARRHAFIALGSNENSAWGSPRRTLIIAVRNLKTIGLHVKAVSDFYTTNPVGGGRQRPYCNAVVQVKLTVGLATLLRLLKRLERAAGRRLGRHWGPRPLDLDILDAGVIIGRHARGRRYTGRLILPHPEMHRRAFVLVPLAEIAPHWRHPCLDRSVQSLLQDRQVRIQTRGVRRVTSGSRS